MARLSWLHLTDLHRGMLAQGSLWPNIEQAFFKDLSWLNEQCGPWNLIFFTGDLVQKGDPREFRKFDATLRRLYEHLNSIGSDPVLIAIPGNHDLKRPHSGDPDLQRLLTFNDDEAVRNEFLTDAGSTLRRTVKRAFAPYVSWHKNHPFRRPEEIKQGLLPGDFAATVDVSGNKIGVVGLNSTFLQLKEGDFSGKLDLDTNQLIAVCGEHFTDWFDAHAVCFLMTHHPPSWLTKISREDLNDEIALPGRFVAHLCGHLHESLQETVFSGGDSHARRCWQGRSLFGLEFYGDDKKFERRHGYSAGVLEINSGQASFRLWPRQAAKHQSGIWRFMGDTSATLSEDCALLRKVSFSGRGP